MVLWSIICKLWCCRTRNVRPYYITHKIFLRNASAVIFPILCPVFESNTGKRSRELSRNLLLWATSSALLIKNCPTSITNSPLFAALCGILSSRFLIGFILRPPVTPESIQNCSCCQGTHRIDNPYKLWINSCHPYNSGKSYQHEYHYN